ncbi:MULTISPECIES: HRDC domain-containing protein [unclassified Psychrobacter]|uniref:ribonuclease D n=1 Tax=unclassified Psychrobacter TaxID=196806 RepID=UPI0025B4E617|nr:MULTISPECIES: HRDC domain-containing protein [unclassified Psychrobacter]MDN3454056.1 HRDC domain-containing protein [Psychrobacter sp. APC 3350]MDN3503418.1 HRDC domain-containing protein [Psychrobacter sp. 5A.1]
MSNNVSNASSHSSSSNSNDGSLQVTNTELLSAAPPCESAPNTSDVDVLDTGVLDIDALLDIADEVAITWIRKQSELDEVIDALATCGRVALDTEFIKRDTYYPRLALVQLNTGNHVYLLDAPQLQLTELWEALRKVEVAIWHACGEDLGIFYLLSGCPPLTNIFDTQIALSYLTGQLQMGYQQALADQLDMHIDKEHSQSDWLQRPLTDEQEQYAIDDVRFLPALYLSLEYELKKQGLYDYVWADCQLYASDLYNTQHVEDDAMYLTMADYRYNSQQMAILKGIATWREELARATNQPRTFVIKKQAVREIVTEKPNSMRELAHKTTMHRSMLRLYGEELLKVIRDAKSLPYAEHPDCLVPPYRSKNKVLSKAVQQAIDDHARAIGVPASVLMRKKWLGQLYEVVALDKDVSELPQGLKGWRNDWVVQTLIPVIEKHKTELQQGMGVK